MQVSIETSNKVCICTYIDIYIYIYICMCTYVYVINTVKDIRPVASFDPKPIKCPQICPKL